MSGFRTVATDRPGATLKVELFGPFFEHDPGKTLSHNVMDMLDKLAAEMEREVKRQIAGHAGEMPRYTGWSHDHTVGYTSNRTTGKRWRTFAAVGTVTAGLSTKDAIRTKAAVAGRRKSRGIGTSKSGRAYGPDGTTKGIEGRFHPYRSVKSGLYRSRALLTADLAKGLD